METGLLAWLPDRYSCAPLYGAYGPYGGRDYWAAYSYGDLRRSSP